MSVLGVSAITPATQSRKIISNKFIKKINIKYYLIFTGVILFIFVGCSASNPGTIDVKSIKEKTKDIKKEDLEELNEKIKKIKK